MSVFDLDIAFEKDTANLKSTFANTQITTPKLHIGSLDVDSLTGQSITGITIIGGTLIGNTFKTATTGQRIEIDPINGFRVFNAAGVVVGQFRNTTITLMTAATGQRVEITAANGLRVFDGAGILQSQFISNTVTLPNSSITNPFLADAAVSTAKTAAAVQAALGDTPDNELTNGGGEEGTVGSLPTGWTHGGGATSAVAEDQTKVGSRSIKMISVAQNSFDSQQFTLQSGYIYELAGWIKTAAHANQPGGYALFNLDNATPLTIIEKNTVGADPAAAEADCGLPLDGVTRDWTFVRCRFKANATEVATLYVQVGFGAVVTATAWFDGIVVRKVHAIYADDVTANAITAGKIDVAFLSAISADLGAVTAGTINAVDITGGTITGTTFLTDTAGNNRVTIDSTNGLQLIDSGNITQLQLNASVFAGILVTGIRGIVNAVAIQDSTATGQLTVFSNNVEFRASSTIRGYFDDNDGNGAGNQPTSLTVRVNGVVQRVNYNPGSGGFLYI